MKKSAYFSDIVFSFLLASLATLVLFRYFGLRLFSAAFLSAVCGALVAGAVAAILKSKRKNLDLKRSDEAQKRKLLLHLTLLSDDQKTKFFQTVLSADGLIAKRFSTLRLYTEELFYFLFFRFSPVTADEVARLSRLKTAKEKVVLCDKIDEEAAALCAKLDIRLKTGGEVYSLVKARELLPENYLGEEQPQNKTKRRLRLAFAKSNSRRFLVSGALLLLTSLITPFRFYYLLFGGILLLAALFIRIFGYS